jgi:putative sterol carrier protein
VAKFPSPEWAELFHAAVNASAEYADAARAWEGDVLLRVLPDEGLTFPSGIQLDLDHGACRSAVYVPDARGGETEFAFEATARDWQRVLRKEADPVKAVLSGQVKVPTEF